MPLPPGRARAFETAGKQGCACVAWSRKRRSGLISRQGVYESPRPSSYAPTCGQSVPKLWPHSRKSSRTAGNRQGWNERVYTRPWPPPTVPLNGWTRRPIPQSAWPLSFWFWSVSFLKIEMGGEAILGLSRLDCPSAKTGGTVNGGAWNAPFILTVDWLGWFCYLLDKLEFVLFVCKS